jgi:uncharacterized protein
MKRHRLAINCAGLLCVASASVLLSCEVHAQTQSGAMRVPEIVASGSAQVSVPPAKASFTVEIKTSASNAAAASAENVRLSRLVMDALHAANIRSNEVAGSKLSVGPNWDYDESGRRQKRAYQAYNSIQIVTEQLEKVTTYIDVALSAGATGVTEAVYSEKDPASTRREALSEAVAAARRDAEIMAQAGGGRLGELELLTTEQSESVLAQRMDRMFKKSVAVEGISLVAPQITVTATVLARWQFLSGASAK